MQSVCGVCCSSDCKAYKKECEGCTELGGRVSWAAHFNIEFCPIHACAAKRSHCSCGDCGEAPCEVWIATRSPLMSDEEFNADIQSRLRNLAGRKSTVREGSE